MSAKDKQEIGHNYKKQISPDEYAEIGRNYYKHKQYDKALETFTEGIESCNKPSYNLYDYRAATYDKLEMYGDAVKDGREMIRLNKKDIKGYLRMGNVLERMGKEETAIGIYKYGMKNIGAADKNFKILQQLHDKIAGKLSTASGIDPFSVLPMELAEMVLEYLSFRQMVNCMRVSKGWRDYLAKIPKLWLHLDLSGARRPVRRSFISTAFKCSEQRMTRVTVHRFEHMDIVKNLAMAAKHLSELELISLPYAASATLIDVVKSSARLKKLVVHADTTPGAIESILTSQPGLEHVALHAVLPTRYTMKWSTPLPHLHTLTLSFTEPVSGQQLQIPTLLALTPSLRSLSLTSLSAFQWPTDASALPQLTSLSIHRTDFQRFPALPPTLQFLSLDNSNGRSQLEHDDVPWADAHLPQLAHLSLSGFTLSASKFETLLDCYVDSQGKVIDYLPGEATPLHHLSLRCQIHGSLFKGPDSVLGTSPRALTPALQDLDLGATTCDDDDVECLLQRETGLASIDVSDTRITGAAIKMLVDGLPRLKRIRADNCTRVSGRDALEYARRKGVVVGYQMGEQKGGRRVRY